ncbi:MAG: AAA family ATPase [Acidimicrobiia bacterium]|nr:AAA family ATPase [Acidimicrobiia bacterium]
MTIERLQVENFRCLQRLVFEPAPDNTLIVGPNGAGKTSLLEAIFLLGRGRSFRHTRTRALIRDGEERLTVGARLVGSDGTTRSTLRVSVDAGGLSARQDDRAVDRLGELARRLPVQVIDPEIHKLVEEGPAWRRRFLDWGTFQSGPAFLGCGSNSGAPCASGQPPSGGR